MSSGRWNNVRVYHSTQELSSSSLERVAVALGVFDGVHIGHRQILSSLAALAEKTHATPMVVTFDPHPRQVLSGVSPDFLTRMEQKLALFDECGIHHVLVIEFTPAFAGLDRQEFLSLYLKNVSVQITGVCVGYNFRFGNQNYGSALFLSQWADEHGMEACIVPAVVYDGTAVSSSRIRDAVHQGQMRAVTQMLGRHYAVQGVVQHGQGIGGKQLSCPTANLVEPDYAMPRSGVYAARTDLDGRLVDGIVYVGTAPTIRKESNVMIELHLFDVDEDLYGRTLDIEFYDFIRESRTFGSRQELMTQIEQDIVSARKALND